LGQKKSDIIELLVICFLVKRKAVDLVIKALAEALKKNKNIILRIVGDGPQKMNLINLVSKLNLEDYVIFEPFVRNDQIARYYKMAHIFVSMTRSESWGQMYLEAMSSGLPIITTHNIGANEIIKKEFGYLVEQENYKQLADFISSLSLDKQLMEKMGENARKEVEERYDWDSVVIPKYLEIYKLN
jgi:glycosyltransferase involved in cell wall biosynthesis